MTATTPAAKKPVAKKPVAKKPVAKPDALDLIFASADKKYGSPVGTLDSIGTDAKFFSTGNMSFDLALGGGFALGRLVELAGPPSCGKSTIASMAAAVMQAIILSGGDPSRGIGPNDVILYVDFENAVDKKYMRNLGLNTSDSSLRFTQPDFLESGAQLIVDVLKTGRVRLIIVDSVAAMNPRAVAEADVGKPLPAILAKILTPWGTTLQQLAHANNCTILFINHEKEVMSMGSRPGLPAIVSTPGGIALKYFQSQRLSFRQGVKHREVIKDPVLRIDESRVTSTDVHMTVVKNKLAPPFRKALARVRDNRGFDNFWSALSILLAHRLVTAQPGGYFFFHKLEEAGLTEDWMAMSKPEARTPARPFIRGIDNVYAAADVHPEWRDRMIKYTEEILPSIVNIDGEVEESEEDSEFSADPDGEVDLSTGEILSELDELEGPSKE